MVLHGAIDATSPLLFDLSRETEDMQKPGAK
jgi:hypothetical protein